MLDFFVLQFIQTRTILVEHARNPTGQSRFNLWENDLVGISVKVNA